jgi:hypothetical protein
MVQLTFAAGALVLGALLLVTVAVVRLGRDWRPARADGGQPRMSGLWRAVDSPAGWSVLFLVLVGIALAGAVLFVSGPDAMPVPGSAGIWLGGLLGTVTVLYFIWGVYSASRYRGLHRPASLAVAAWMVGVLVLAVIVAKLLGVV